MIAADFPSLELIVFFAAAIIWVINGVVGWARSIRQRTAERQAQRDAADGIDFVQPKRTGKAKPAAPPPLPGREPAPPPAVMSTPYTLPLPVKRAKRRRPARRPEPPDRLPLDRPVVKRAFKPAPPLRRRVHAPRRKAPAVAALLHDPTQVRNAIVLREILGPPRAMRPWRPLRGN